MTLTLSPKQSNVYAWGWQPGARFRYAVCGRRFGKTHLGLAEINRAIRLAVRRKIPTDNEIWYGAPNKTQAKRVLWQRLKNSIPGTWRAEVPNETLCSIQLTSGHTVRLVGFENPDTLRGSTLYFFIGDEWADCPADAWSTIIRPMLSTAQGHALFMGTPKGFDHFYEGYVAGQPGGRADTRSWQYTTIQGGQVPATEVEAARADLDLRTFRQEYEATFETFAGRVYYAFSRQDSVRPCPHDPALPVHVGMDFNINPMSATVWQERGSEVWQVDEIVIPTSNTHEMADELIRRYARPGGVVAHITVYPDPAGAQRRTSASGRTDHSILRDKGLAVVAQAAHPAVRDRINLVNGRFQSADGHRRAYVDPRCRQSIQAWERLAYREGTSEPDKESGYDHLPDATGYFMWGRYGVTRAQRTNVPHLGR